MDKTFVDLDRVINFANKIIEETKAFPEDDRLDDEQIAAMIAGFMMLINKLEDYAEYEKIHTN